MAERSTDEMVAMLSSADELDRVEAAYLIGQRADRRATLALVSAIARERTEGRALRAVGALALGKLRDGRGLPTLLELGRAKEPDALEALGMLGRLGKKDAVPVLLAALAVPKLRRVAGRALGRLGSPGITRGRVSAFEPARAFGFVRPREGKPLFFHARDWDSNESPRPGMGVTFYALRDIPKPCAVRLRTIERTSLVVDPSQGIDATGTVQWFDPIKAYGFITRDGTGESALARGRDIDDGRMPRALRSKERVRFLAVPTEAGLRALHVHAESRDLSIAEPATNDAATR